MGPAEDGSILTGTMKKELVEVAFITHMQGLLLKRSGEEFSGVGTELKLVFEEILPDKIAPQLLRKRLKGCCYMQRHNKYNL